MDGLYEEKVKRSVDRMRVQVQEDSLSMRENELNILFKPTPVQMQIQTRATYSAFNSMIGSCPVNPPNL
jgi:hypothetical protein